MMKIPFFFWSEIWRLLILFWKAKDLTVHYIPYITWLLTPPSLSVQLCHLLYFNQTSAAGSLPPGSLISHLVLAIHLCLLALLIYSFLGDAFVNQPATWKPSEWDFPLRAHSTTEQKIYLLISFDAYLVLKLVSVTQCVYRKCPHFHRNLYCRIINIPETAFIWVCMHVSSLYVSGDMCLWLWKSKVSKVFLDDSPLIFSEAVSRGEPGVCQDHPV